MNRWPRLLVAIAIVVGSAICTTPAAHAAPAATCASAPLSIAVVVDFGDGSPVSAACVPSSSTDNGASVLAARAEALGTPAPRFSSSGLLCAIDGTPSDGCGDQTGSKYAYWSYWHGTADGGWSYSNVGPGGARVHATTVEGWRFQPEGAGNPSDPPPEGSADPATTCVPAPPPTSGESSSSSSSSSHSTTSSSTSDVAVEPQSTTTVTVATSSGSTSTASSSSSRAVAAAPVRVTAREKGGGPVWGMLIGGGLLVALGVSGAVIARRRATP